MNENKLENCYLLNDLYCSDDFVKEMQEIWGKKEHLDANLSTEDVKVISSPFNCAFLPNFFNDVNLLKNITEELKYLPIEYRNNDLYKFKCTKDLKGVEVHPNIQSLCKFIRKPLRKWVQKVTGIKLNNKVAISCSKYDYTDVLLCHDDELEDRRIAFILYLVPSWEKEYGGSLDLFSVDNQNRPKRISQRLYPQFNSFAFFEVSPISFHQVSEVLVKGKTRLSINGWFHGEPISYPPKPPVKIPTFLYPGEVELRVVYAWVNPSYLHERTQADIRAKFLYESEIQLPNFLTKKKYNELSQALKETDLSWRWIGPPNERQIETLRSDGVPDVIEEFRSLMLSDAMFLILSQLTGLELHHLAPREPERRKRGKTDSRKNENEDEDSEEEESEDYEDENEGDCGNEWEDDDQDECEGQDAETHGRNGEGIEEAGRDGESEGKVSEVASTSGEGREIKKRKRKSGKEKTKRRKEEQETAVPDWLLEGEGTAGLLDEGCESDADDDEIRRMAEERKKGDSTLGAGRVEVRRWRWGAYSLMKDDQLDARPEFTLDASLFCNASPKWGEEGQRCGGRVVYVAKDGNEELLSVAPAANCLALVYRDNKTFRFTKHVNASSWTVGSDAVFQEVFCEYKEIEKT